MELRHLRSFVVLAEDLHFGRAAKRLGISQPALSQQLRRLEAELGVVLVVRTSRETSLTDIGEVFLASAQRAVSEAERGISAVRETSEGRIGRLVIGCLGAGANGPLTDLVSEFRRAGPPHMVEIHHYSDSASQERGLLAGSLDLIVVRTIANVQAIVMHKLLDESFVVYVPESHRLAQRESVALAELSGEPFVLWPRRVGPSYYDLVVDGCRGAGFEPRIDGIGTSLEAQLCLVAAGVGISLQAASNASISRRGVAMLTLEAGSLVSPLWLAHSRWPRNALVGPFIESLGQGRTPTTGE